MNFEVTQLLKFWTQKTIENKALKRGKPSLGLLVENESETI